MMRLPTSILLTLLAVLVWAGGAQAAAQETGRHAVEHHMANVASAAGPACDSVHDSCVTPCSTDCAIACAVGCIAGAAVPRDAMPLVALREASDTLVAPDDLRPPDRAPATPFRPPIV